MGDLLTPTHLVILALILSFPFAWWRIFEKAGFPPALSLLILVPGVNLVVFYVFAFSRWRVVPLAALTPPPLPTQYPQYPPYPPER